ncbi:GtrA family protein [Escherichia coli]|uniref:GtrA family protein n=1 Tax=Escherichia coli TaxID=562 RepID=UPI003987D0CF
MLKLFASYTSFGVLNTLIHWVVFGVCIYGLSTSQALEYLPYFLTGTNLGFYANARFTFKASTSTLRYMLYVGFMGTLSAAVGWATDGFRLPPIITLIAFSAIESICRACSVR